MRIRSLVGVLFLFPAGCIAADKVQPLNIKTGLWETTTIITINGRQTDPDTDKRCETREKLEKGLDFVMPKGAMQCTQTVLTSTSSKFEIRIACEVNGMKNSGTLNFEAPNPETVRGSTHLTITAGGRTKTMDMNITSRWLGQACGGVE